MCFLFHLGKGIPTTITTEMTTDEVKHVIRGFEELGVQVVSFTGGEPTLRKDFGELLQYTKDHGMMATMATNGYYLEEKIISGELDGAEWIMVSIDWPDAERHDKYRRIKVFDRAIRGIKAARRAGKIIIISTVVTKENIVIMDEMVKLAKDLDALIELLPCEDIIREQEGESHVVDEIDTYIPDIGQWAEEIRRLSKHNPHLITDTITTQIIEAGGFGNQDLLHCVMAQSFLTIKYNGEMIFPCKIHPILKVNVKDKRLWDVYYSSEAKKIIDMKDGFPFCKGCRLGCAIATSIPTRWSTVYEKYIKAFMKGMFF